ncbi:MAG: Fe-S cluster assembly protein SufD [Bacillota bacterium]|nr:Fe-S cluster assembly protein SufD [Bacillota bacterium]
MEKLNSIAVPTWKHLKVNYFELKEFQLPLIKEYNKEFLYIDDDAKEEAIVEKTNSRITQKCGDIKDTYGVNDTLVQLAEENYNSGVIAIIPRNLKLKEAIRLEFNMDEDNPVVVDNNVIIAEEGSKVTLVIDYNGREENNVFHNGITKIIAKENSEVTIIKVQRLNNTAYHFDSNMAYVGRNAKVNWVDIQIGSKVGVTSYITNLNEDLGSSQIYSAYMIDGKRVQDLSYTMTHRGRRTDSVMEIKGVLKDEAKKVFRGNIDFKRGAVKSKGAQNEDVLLLDKTVKADSVPMLLCEEDDVEGEHAASAGQMNEDKLFYLMSRGLSEKESKKLAIEASFSPIIDKVPFEDLRNSIHEELERRIVGEKYAHI